MFLTCSMENRMKQTHIFPRVSDPHKVQTWEDANAWMDSECFYFHKEQRNYKQTEEKYMHVYSYIVLDL